MELPPSILLKLMIRPYQDGRKCRGLKEEGAMLRNLRSGVRMSLFTTEVALAEAV